MGVRYRFGLGCMLSACLFLQGFVATVQAMDTSLDGEWKFRAVPIDRFGENEDQRAAEYSRKDLNDSDWERISVPGYWDQPRGRWPWSNPMQPGGPDPAHDGEAWYRRTFTIPENRFPIQGGGDGYYATLRFQGVSAQTSVWLNGSFVGRHLGAFAPFELNVTEALLRDEPNVLSIRVRDKAVFRAPTTEGRPAESSRIPLGFDPDSGGIHGSVAVRIAPRERIVDLAVFSDAESATVEVLVSAEAVGNGTLTLEVTEEKNQTRTTVISGDSAPSIPIAARTARIPIRESFPAGAPPKTWSPESPVVYRVSAKLTSSRGGVDVAETTFGFRSFSLADGEFRLNGAPYFLLGAGSPPHYEKPKAGVMREHLQHLKDAGVRMVRFAHEPPDSKWLDLCDELGLLAWVEGPLSGGSGRYDFSAADLVATASRELQALARSLRNHPSLAIWAMGSGNSRALTEVQERARAETVLAAIAREVSKIDPDAVAIPESDSRDLIASPVADWQSGLGWYTRKNSDWLPFLHATASRVGGATAPWVCSALETGYSSAGQGRPIPDPLEEAAMRMRIGDVGEDRNRLLFAQSKRIKELIETTRAARNRQTNRIAGVFPYTSANWFFHPLTENRMRPKPLLSAIKEAYAPTVLSIQVPKRHFFSGDLLSATVTVVNDRPDQTAIRGGNLILEAFVGADELNSQTQRENLEVKPNTSLPFSMVAVLPEPEQGLRRTTIRARLLVGDETAAVNETEVRVASTNWIRPRLEAGAVGLLIHDPKGSLSPFLEKFNLSPQPFTDFDQLSEAVGLVVGEGGFDDHLQRGWPVVEKWLEAGGRMAVVGAPPVRDRWSYSGPYPPGIRTADAPGWPSGIDRVEVAVEGHPLFEGVRFEALEEWGEDRVVARHLLEWEDDRATRFGHRTLVRVAVYDGSFRWGKVVVEERFSEGSVIYSQLDLARKSLRDPIACRILANLFEWTVDSISPVVFEPPPSPTRFLDPLVGESQNQLTAEFGGTGEDDPIRALIAADGPFEATSCCGVDSTVKMGVLPLPHDFGPEKRVYYDIDDRFWYNRTGRAEIKVLVNCLAPTKLRLDYDSDDKTVEHLGHYRQSKVVDVLEVGIWKEVVFSAPQALFANRQQNGADFRLTTVSGEAVYGPITLRRVE